MTCGLNRTTINALMDRSDIKCNLMNARQSTPLPEEKQVDA